jgi:hypothetical protein
VVAPVEEDLNALAVDADEHVMRVALATERGDAEDVVGHGTLDLGHDDHTGVHLAVPEVVGEAVQDAVRVLRDPVDVGAPLERRRGSRGLRAWRWVDDVHQRLAVEHKEEEAICKESERWGESRAGWPEVKARSFGSRDFVRFWVRFKAGRTRTDLHRTALSTSWLDPTACRFAGDVTLSVSPLVVPESYKEISCFVVR